MAEEGGEDWLVFPEALCFSVALLGGIFGSGRAEAGAPSTPSSPTPVSILCSVVGTGVASVIPESLVEQTTSRRDVLMEVLILANAIDRFIAEISAYPASL
jgi:hypothetical protein